MEKFGSVLAQGNQALLLLVLTLIGPVVRHLQIDPLGQEADGVRIAQAFDLHDKIDHTAALVAAEAVVHLLVRRDGKGRCFFPVEGTEAEIVCAAPLELDILADDLLDWIPGNQLIQKCLWKRHANTSFST